MDTTAQDAALSTKTCRNVRLLKASLEQEIDVHKTKKLKLRARSILQALSDLGGEASTREISAKVDLSVNGVSQTLGALSPLYVQCLRDSGTGGDTRWRRTETPI